MIFMMVIMLMLVMMIIIMRLDYYDEIKMQDDALDCMALISMTSMAEEVWCREWGNQFSSAPNKVSLMIWHKYSDRRGYIGSLLTPSFDIVHFFTIFLEGFRQIGHRILRGLAPFWDGKNVSISFLLTFTIYWSQLALRYVPIFCCNPPYDLTQLLLRRGKILRYLKIPPWAHWTSRLLVTPTTSLLSPNQITKLQTFS